MHQVFGREVGAVPANGGAGFGHVDMLPTIKVVLASTCLQS